MDRDRDPEEGSAPRGVEPPEKASAPPPPEELTIVRNLADEYAAGGPPVWEPPPPPKEKTRAEPEPEPELELPAPDPTATEPREPLIRFDWDQELSPTRVPRHRPPPPREERPSPPKKEPFRPFRVGPLHALNTAVTVGGAAFAAATLLMALRLEPVHTWYYLFAWYPFLLVVNWSTARVLPEHSILARPTRPVVMLFLWSVPTWLFFEIWNFRLQDWYYVGVPANLLARRIGVVASFATVLPGIFFLEEALTVRRLFESARTPRFPLRPSLTKVFLVTGGACSLLLLAWPTIFFPLLWGVPVLFLEPWLARGRGPSLLRELADGRPGRIFRLLVAGLGCGLFWEAANHFAGGKWIYTVPSLETSKLFEMPVAGFVGFAPFALSCWVMARALVQLGLLPEWEIRTKGTPAPPPAAGPLRFRGRTIAATSTVIISLLTLRLMDWLTIDSFAPRAENIPNIPDGIVEYARDQGKGDIRGVLEMAEAGEFYIPGESSTQTIQQLGGQARLVLLRGIGTENARRLDLAGVRSTEELAAREADALLAALRELDEPGWWPRERRVRVWIAAAQRALE
jgi:hypothetical protein